MRCRFRSGATSVREMFKGSFYMAEKEFITSGQQPDVPRSQWSGKLAFILAGAASAVGLGNLWRFPTLAAKFGGGTFLLVYIIFAFTFGISMLLLETSLGRKTGQSVIGAYSYFGKKYRFIGWLAVIVPFIITPYYCIIGGWVARYTVGYVVDGTATLADGGAFFASFITSPTAAFAFMLIFMALTFLVVAMGVKGGIEKANYVMMPALIVMALVIAIYIVMQPGAAEGAAYYLIPDFSKFSPELLIGAMGQMFYSLSLAMGIMVTYGSYLEKKESLTGSVASIAGFDLLVSFLSGLMIVPVSFMVFGSAEEVMANSGPSLMFITLPQAFQDMGAAGGVIGFVFFLLVLFAALTSSISLTEACVSIVQDGTHWTRRRSLIATMIVIVVVGTVVCAGYNVLSFVQPLGDGSTLLDFFDFISNSVIMPIVAFLTCFFVGWVIKPKTLIAEVRASSRFRLAGAWTVMIKYIAPILVVIILLANVL